MNTLTCEGCGRTVSVEKIYGDEVCKECNKPMTKKVEPKKLEKTNPEMEEPVIKKAVVAPTAEDLVEEVEEEEEEKESKVTLPVNYNFCGELPDFTDNEVI